MYSLLLLGSDSLFLLSLPADCDIWTRDPCHFGSKSLILYHFFLPLLRLLPHNGSYQKILTCFIIDCLYSTIAYTPVESHLLSGIWLHTNRWIATALPSAVWPLCIGAVGLKYWTVGSKVLARPCHFALKQGSHFSDEMAGIKSPKFSPMDRPWKGTVVRNVG